MIIDEIAWYKISLKPKIFVQKFFHFWPPDFEILVGDKYPKIVSSIFHGIYSFCLDPHTGATLFGKGFLQTKPVRLKIILLVRIIMILVRLTN